MYSASPGMDALGSSARLKAKGADKEELARVHVSPRRPPPRKEPTDRSATKKGGRTKPAVPMVTSPERPASDTIRVVGDATNGSQSNDSNASEDRTLTGPQVTMVRPQAPIGNYGGMGYGWIGGSGMWHLVVPQGGVGMVVAIPQPGKVNPVPVKGTMAVVPAHTEKIANPPVDYSSSHYSTAYGISDVDLSSTFVRSKPPSTSTPKQDSDVYVCGAYPCHGYDKRPGLGSSMKGRKFPERSAACVENKTLGRFRQFVEATQLPDGLEDKLAKRQALTVARKELADAIESVKVKKSDSSLLEQQKLDLQVDLDGLLTAYYMTGYANATFVKDLMTEIEDKESELVGYSANCF